MSSELQKYFQRAKEAIELIDIQQVENLINLLLEARERQSHIIIFGNGGSGGTASHIAGDYLKGVSYGLDKGFKFISLNDNMPAFSAIANDLDYSEVFVQQLKVLMNPQDLVIGISGSGNSLNVVKALEYANENQGITVAICGYSGGKIKQIAQHVVHVPVHDMEITEDMHVMVFHAIKQELIRRLKGDKATMGDKYEKRLKQQQA